MASTACFLHHHAFSHAPIISKSSSSQRHRPNIKPSKLVCRAQNQDHHHQVQGDISRRSVLDGLIVGSAAIGSALASAGAAYALPTSGKSSWPELVGVKGEVAVAKIEEENPNVKAVIVPPEQKIVDAMFASDRVQVFVNEKGLVTRVPVIG